MPNPTSLRFSGRRSPGSWLAFGFLLFPSASELRAQPRTAPEPPKSEEKEVRGLRLKSEGAAPGYVMISPLMSLRTVLLDADGKVVHEWKADCPPGNSVFLKDNGNLIRCGRIDDGDIFEGGGIGGRVQEFTFDGELVWDYPIADDKRHHHHDVEPLPNGNFVMIVWERKSDTQATLAGRDPELMEAGELWPDALYEIAPDGKTGGKVVWEWHAWDHLIQDFSKERAHYGDVAAHPERLDINADKSIPKRPVGPPGGGPPGGGPLGGGPPGGGHPPGGGPDDDKARQLGYAAGAAKDAKGKRRNVRGADWTHTNGIDYDAKNDLLVISTPNLSEIWVIDHSTTTEEAKGSTGGRHGKGGDFVYRYGNPITYRGGTLDDRSLFRQHDIQWIDDGLPGAGHFLVFNNGPGRPGGDRSTVDEFVPVFDESGKFVLPTSDPKTHAKMIWSYGTTDDQKFFSSFISGVQRLSNGNTLICSGEQGRVFEVTKEGKTVWEYWNEIGGDAPKKDGPGGGINPYALFRATKIAPDHPGLARLKVAH